MPMAIRTFAGIILVGLAASFCTIPAASSEASELNIWQSLKVGNGGFLFSPDVADDGTLVVTTDTFGCYYWEISANSWVQILNTSKLPAGTVPAGLGATALGCDAIAIDHSNSNNIWVYFYGSLYKSTDKGLSFSATGFPKQPANFNLANTGRQNHSALISVDPNQSNVVFVSTPSSGLYVTTNGGATFAAVTSVAAGLPVNEGQTANNSAKAGTDNTTLAIDSGLKAFKNNSEPFRFSIGSFVQIWETSNPANQMLGIVAASGSTTFTLNVSKTQGSGTHSDWTVSKQNAVAGGHRIAFDTSGGTISVDGQIRTANVFVHTYNVNTWKSTDGGQTFATVNAMNKPTGIRQMHADPFGVLWVLDDDYPVSNSNVDKYDGNVWAAHLDAYNGINVWFDAGAAVDPKNCSAKAHCHVAFVAGSSLLVSTTPDGGATWSQSGNSASTRSFASSGDVDWILGYFNALNSTGRFFFGANGAIFDPSNPGRLYIAAEGMWFGTPSTTTGSLHNITMTQQTRGIEEFVPIKIVSPVADSVIVTAWDFPCFYTNQFDAYPRTISCQPGAAQTQLKRGYSIDYVWNSPSTIVALSMDGTGSTNLVDQNFSGVTTNGGHASTDWAPFSGRSSITAGSAGGCIAIQNSSTIVFVPVASAIRPQITTDGGSTWSEIAPIPSTSWGPIANFAPYSKSCESDKANGDIYLYNINVNGRGRDGVYRYSSGKWSTLTSPNFASSYINEQMKSTGGRAGDLFFTPGLQGGVHPRATPFYYTANGWISKFTVIGFQEVITFAFGAKWPGKSYPGMYVYGWFTGTEIVNGSSTSVTKMLGYHMCKDFNPGTGRCDSTWTLLGNCDAVCLSQSQQYPMGIISNALDMDADKTTPGKVYVWTPGGAFWGQFN